jgi:hypothetical protein
MQAVIIERNVAQARVEELEARLLEATRLVEQGQVEHDKDKQLLVMITDKLKGSVGELERMGADTAKLKKELADSSKREEELRDELESLDVSLYHTGEGDGDSESCSVASSGLGDGDGGAGGGAGGGGERGIDAHALDIQSLTKQVAKRDSKIEELTGELER